MGRGILSLVYRRSGETVKTVPYNCTYRRRTIIGSWIKQYGENRIWIHAEPYANENMVGKKGKNCTYIKALPEKIIQHFERPKAEYDNHTPLRVLESID